MSYKVSIIDNNLLRAITRIGDYNKYVKYFDEANKRQLVSAETRLTISPAGTLEFLGMKLPKVDIETSDLEASASHLLKRLPIDYSQVHILRARLMDRYEKSLIATNCYSKQVFSKSIGNLKQYIDPQLRTFIFDLLKKNLFNLDGRMLLYNRVALDRSLQYRWQNKFEDYIQASLLSDLVHSYESKIGFGSLRGLSRLWMVFSAMVDQRVKKGEFIGNLKAEDILKNNQITRDILKLDKTGDFLDVEAYHLLNIGKFEDDENHPVLFATMDPVDSILIRIGLFKSFLKNAFEAARNIDPTREGYFKLGRVLVFNTNIKVEYDILVTDVEPLLDMMGDKRIEDWLSNKKEIFQQ